MSADVLATIDTVIARLRSASWKDRDAIKAELLTLAEAAPNRDVVRDHLAEAARGISDLEVRWEIEEVVEALKPPPVPVEPPKEEEPKKAAPDFVLVYDDPRGLQLFKTKTGDRWAAQQVDPRTGQPMSFELHPQEVEQLKVKLRGSPYWVLGAGGLGA